MTLKRQEGTGNLTGSTRSHSVEKPLWKRLWTCRNTLRDDNDDNNDYVPESVIFTTVRMPNLKVYSPV